MLNTNDDPFQIRIQCERTKNKDRAFWKAYCDRDGDGEQLMTADDLEHDTIVATNKCKPVNNMKSLWELNCGKGKETRQCGVDLVNAQAVNNPNPEPFPIIAQCIKRLTPTRTRWSYTCDHNQNGLQDSSHSMITIVGREKFDKIEFNCGSYDNCLGCQNKHLKSFVVNKETENPGSIIYECVETIWGGKWGAEKAKYRYACDNNQNGIIDDGDKIKEVIVKRNSKGKCERGKFEMRCTAPTTTTPTSTSTTTLTTTAPPVTEKCYNCFNLGTEDGNSFESLIVNINPEPLSPTLTCIGPENEKEPEDLPDNQGRFKVQAHCDLNGNGLIDDGELTRELVGKKRDETFCGKVSPAAWEIDCGFAACPVDACSISDVLSVPSLYTWSDTIPIVAECLGQNADNKNSHDWRFFCDDNQNGVFDEGEKSEMSDLHKENDCTSHQTQLICGKSESGQCSPFPAFSCTTEDVLTEPNTDWYAKNEVNKNINWENTFVYRDNGYEGNIQAHCSEIINVDHEMWTLYCDDNNNGLLDKDEKSIQTVVKHELKVAKTNSTWTCAFDDLRHDASFICGDYEPTLRDILTSEEDFTSRGLTKKALKQCGFKYMGPRYYGAPRANEFDKETGVCIDEGMQNAFWETKTAGNPIIGGAGFIQQSLGRDYPYPIAIEEGYSNKKNPDKNPELERYYDEAMSNLYNHYIPCYKEMDKLGGNIIQYTQMYSLSKGERLFGWESQNIIDISNEAYLFYMRDFIDGLFYDISPIQTQEYWRQWDYNQMKKIHQHTENLWADYSDLKPNFITNSGATFAIYRGGATQIMSYEGQVGAVPEWTNTTYYKEDPITANTFWAHTKTNDVNAAHFMYGNLNYQQMAMMNSVTNGQVAALEEHFPGVHYFDRALELFKDPYHIFLFYVKQNL